MCGAAAAFFVADRHVHDVLVGGVEAGVIEPPHWRCAGCAAALLQSGRWCACGHFDAGSDRRLPGVRFAHYDDSLALWARLCGLLAAVPDGMLVTVARDLDAQDRWCLGVSTEPEQPINRRHTSETFPSLECLIRDFTTVLEAVSLLDTLATRRGWRTAP